MVKSIDQIVYDSWYQSGILASVDWVAGGNFDGGIYQYHLKFLKKDNKVVMKITEIVYRRKWLKPDKLLQGKFDTSYKGSIKLSFDDFTMNGFVLGEHGRYIAFDLSFKGTNRHYAQAYELNVSEND